MRIAVIGLGVIGGSLALAWSARGHQVTGIDRHQRTIDRAREAGAIVAGTTDISAGVQGAEVVVLAVPVASIISVARSLAELLPSSVLVTDVGSTKKEITDALDELYPSLYLGGHPMTGSELAGFAGADQYLFESAFYVLTPTAHTGGRPLRVMQDLVTQTGARLLLLDPRRHDLMVGVVSHLPHLLAVALMNYAASFEDGYPDTLALAAGGFRDMTRIASGDAEMWRDIYASNRHNLTEIIAGFRQELDQMETLLKSGKPEEMTASLEKARCSRCSIPLRAKGALPAVYEVVVTIPDRPGSIASVAGRLGQAGLNITDIEIMRVREGEGGSIRVAFKTEKEADTACRILHDDGVKVKRR